MGMLVKLEHYRKLNNMSVRQLSIKSGISRSYISDIEKGTYNPSVLILAKFCKVLGVDPNNLINEEFWK